MPEDKTFTRPTSSTGDEEKPEGIPRGEDEVGGAVARPETTRRKRSTHVAHGI